MKKLDISSSSASYLRQLLRSNNQPKAETSVEPSTVTQPKADTTPTQPKADNTPVTQPKADNVQVNQTKSDVSVEPSTVNDAVEIVVDNAEAFADSVANLAKAEGLDLNAVIEALLKRI
jgi:hypothetical protein